MPILRRDLKPGTVFRYAAEIYHYYVSMDPHKAIPHPKMPRLIDGHTAGWSNNPGMNEPVVVLWTPGEIQTGENEYGEITP